MTITRIGHVAVAGGANGGTTATLDTTGADLIVIGVSEFDGGPVTLSDSKSNTYTAAIAQTSNSPDARIYYKAAPTVGTGHTFTWARTSAYCVITVEAFAGAHATPLDQTNSASGGAFDSSNARPGSVTPSEDGEVCVVNFSHNPLGTHTAPTGYTISDQIAYAGGNNFGGVMASVIQTTATATNPLFTFTGSASGALCIATFKAAAGGTDANVSASVVTATVSIPTAVPATGATVAASVVTAAVSVPALTVAIHSTIAAAVVTATVSVPTATPAVGSTITGSVVTAAVSVPTAIPAVGSTVPAAVVTAVVEVPAPAVTAGGAADVSASVVTATVSIPTATPAVGSTITASVVTATVSVPSASASAGVAVTASVVTASVSVPTPALSSGSTVTASVVTAVVSVLAAASIIAEGSGPPAMTGRMVTIATVATRATTYTRAARASQHTTAERATEAT